MRRWIVVGMMLAVLGGCSTPRTNIYSLYLGGDQTVRDRSAGADLVVHTRALRYLTQPYIACRTSPYQLEISPYSKWVASPEEMVRDAFRERFALSGLFREVRSSSSGAAGSHVLEIDLKRFERTDLPAGSSAEVLLEYSFLSPEGKELARGTVSKKVALADSGFLELAKALSAGLSEGIDEVRAAVAKTVPSGS